jgi:hypothetical protein
MGSSLIVGRLPSAEAHDDARTYLAAASDAALTRDAQVKLLKRWRAAPKEVAYLDPLNLGLAGRVSQARGGIGRA